MRRMGGVPTKSSSEEEDFEAWVAHRKAKKKLEKGGRGMGKGGKARVLMGREEIE